MGGGVAPLQLAAHLFPSLVTQRFEPIPLWPTNACEIAVVGSFLPLAIACFCDHRTLLRWAAARRRALLTWGAGLAAMLVWMLVPIPGRLAPVLNLVPPARMLWGFGLLLTIGLTVIASGATWRLTRARIAAFIGVVLTGWAVSKLGLARAPIEFDRFDAAIVPILVTLLLFRRWAPGALPPRRLALTAVLLTALVTFGTFNPIQSAVPIFAHLRSPVLDTFAAYARANPKGWAIAPGMYGSTINGAGVPAINHTLLQPQTAVFRAAYPELDAATLDAIFNRYAHIVPTTVWTPGLPLADVIAAPPDPFAIPAPVRVANAAAPAPAAEHGSVERLTAVRLGPRRWGVLATGWTDWRGVGADQGLRVWLDETGGRIVRATAYRLPRPDVVAALADRSAFAAGFGLRLEVEVAGAVDAFPARRLEIVAVDAEHGARALSIQAVGPAAGGVIWPQHMRPPHR
jgi:hypothetical protein